MSITSIKDNVLARLASVLGPDYSKLSYMVDIQNNKFGRSDKRYGVLPNSASETSGLLQNLTIDHEFIFAITDSYNNGATSQINDNLKAERINELQDKILVIYKDLALQARTLGSNVLVVNNLQINQPEFLEDEKVIIQKFTLIIKYRNQI